MTPPPAVLAPNVALERLEQKWRDAAGTIEVNGGDVRVLRLCADELATLRAGLAQQGEAAIWQHRMRPTWREEGQGWTAWEECTRAEYETYLRTPVLHDWQHETRALFTHPAAVDAAKGEVRLWDSQWVNITCHENCFHAYDKDEAVAKAVRLTEEAIARNVRTGSLPPPRDTAALQPATEGENNGNR